MSRRAFKERERERERTICLLAKHFDSKAEPKKGENRLPLKKK